MIAIKIIKIIGKEFFYGGHLLSLGAVGLVFSVMIILDLKADFLFFLVVYFWTESVYLYNRFREVKKDLITSPKRTNFFKKRIKYIPFVILSFFIFGVIILIFLNKPVALFFGLLLFFLSILYSLFLKNFTKKIVGFKSFFVSLMWSLIVIFLIIYYSIPFSLGIFLLALFVFLKIFIHEEFLNFTDAKGDSKQKLQTFAIALGEKKLLKFLNIVNLATMVPVVLGVYLNVIPKYSLGFFLMIPYVFYYLKVLPKTSKNNEILFISLVDGEFILWPIIILIFKNII